MAYELNFPIVRLYGGELSVVDYSKTAKGYDITVHITREDYRHAQTLRRLSLRIEHDERIFHARKISDFDITKQEDMATSDVVIEFIGEMLKQNLTVKPI